MKNTLILLFMVFAFSTSYATEPCNCIDYHQKTLEYFKKGDVKSILIETADFYLAMMDQRLLTCNAVLSDKKTSSKKKTQLRASISNLTKVRSEVYKTKAGLSKLTIKSHGDYKAQLHKIQGRAGEVLQASSDILYDKYHGDEIPPPIIIGGIGNGCNEGESPPNHDCGYISGRISNECFNAIDQKMQCGYYNDFGSTEAAQAQLDQDQQACTQAAETQQERCQQANRDCDHNYNPMQGMYDFMRQASQDCSLRDNLNSPLQTETTGGN